MENWCWIGGESGPGTGGRIRLGFMEEENTYPAPDLSSRWLADGSDSPHSPRQASSRLPQLAGEHRTILSIPSVGPEQ